MDAHQLYETIADTENLYPLYVEMAVSEILSFEKYSVFLRRDNIVQIQTKDNFDCELNDARNILKCIEKVSNGNKYPLLVIYANFNTFSKEVKAYIASHKLTTADALVTPANNLALKIVGNIYLRINKPVRPTKIFSNVEDALVWLKTCNQ